MLGTPKWYTSVCSPVGQPTVARSSAHAGDTVGADVFPKGQTWSAHSCALCSRSVKTNGKKLSETPALPAHIDGVYQAVAWSSSPIAAQIGDFHKKDVTWCANGHSFHWTCALDRLNGDPLQACPVCDLSPVPELHAEFSTMAEASHSLPRVEVICAELKKSSDYTGEYVVSSGTPHDDDMLDHLMGLLDVSAPHTYSLIKDSSVFENLTYDQYRDLWSRYGNPKLPPEAPPEGYEGMHADQPISAPLRNEFGTEAKTFVPTQDAVLSTLDKHFGPEAIPGPRPPGEVPPGRLGKLPISRDAVPPKVAAPEHERKNLSLLEWRELKPTYLPNRRNYARSPNFPGYLLKFKLVDDKVQVDFELELVTK